MPRRKEPTLLSKQDTSGPSARFDSVASGHQHHPPRGNDERRPLKGGEGLDGINVRLADDIMRIECRMDYTDIYLIISHSPTRTRERQRGVAGKFPPPTHAPFLGEHRSTRPSPPRSVPQCTIRRNPPPESRETAATGGHDAARWYIVGQPFSNPHEAQGNISKRAHKRLKAQALKGSNGPPVRQATCVDRANEDSTRATTTAAISGRAALEGRLRAPKPSRPHHSTQSKLYWLRAAHPTQQQLDQASRPRILALERERVTGTPRMRPVSPTEAGCAHG